MRDEDLVETVDEGEEVFLSYVVGLEGRWICSGEWAAIGVADRLG
jgi:hypothetical protein